MSGHSGNKLIKKELRNRHNTVCQRFLLIHNLTINPHSRMTALPKCVRQRNDTDKWFREPGNGLGWKEPLRITQSCHPAIPRTSAIRSGPSISQDFSMSLPRQFFPCFIVIRSLLSHTGLLPSMPIFLHVGIRSSCAL